MNNFMYKWFLKIKDIAIIEYLQLVWVLVKSFMLIKVALLSESSIAHFTSEWFITSMNSHVINEVPSLIEKTAAVVVFTDIVSEVSSTFFVELVAYRVLVFGEFCFLSLLHFEVLRLIEEEIFLLQAYVVVHAIFQIAVNIIMIVSHWHLHLLGVSILVASLKVIHKSLLLSLLPASQ